MTSVRAAKSKGSQFEYDVLYNLQLRYPDMYLTSKQGFQQQYDLRDDTNFIVVECKFHKSISWNQAKKWINKLRDKAPKGYATWLVFKSNQQPVLFMKYEYQPKIHTPGGMYMCTEFESVFGKFKKHPSTRAKK